MGLAAANGRKNTAHGLAVLIRLRKVAHRKAQVFQHTCQQVGACHIGAWGDGGNTDELLCYVDGVHSAYSLHQNNRTKQHFCYIFSTGVALM